MSVQNEEVSAAPKWPSKSADLPPRGPSSQELGGESGERPPGGVAGASLYKRALHMKVHPEVHLGSGLDGAGAGRKRGSVAPSAVATGAAGSTASSPVPRTGTELRGAALLSGSTVAQTGGRPVVRKASLTMAESAGVLAATGWPKWSGAALGNGCGLSTCPTEEGLGEGRTLPASAAWLGEVLMACCGTPSTGLMACCGATCAAVILTASPGGPVMSLCGWPAGATKEDLCNGIINGVRGVTMMGAHIGISRAVAKLAVGGVANTLPGVTTDGGTTSPLGSIMWTWGMAELSPCLAGCSGVG